MQKPLRINLLFPITWYFFYIEFVLIRENGFNNQCAKQGLTKYNQAEVILFSSYLDSSVQNKTCKPISRQSQGTELKGQVYTNTLFAQLNAHVSDGHQHPYRLSHFPIAHFCVRSFCHETFQGKC